ncbi:DUF4367 domain-containing protein [Ruminococcaceae bacterium OttesenSCG-928-A11]|nr:DUF4367 domain-containing protein [Ruminococcaceae bacterium OttesenSCG-928-A11]
MREETVTINGVLYNAKTGQPIKKLAPRIVTTKPTPKPAPKKVYVRQPKKIVVKSSAQKAAKRKPSSSKTLNRQFVRKPIVVKKARNENRVAKKNPPQKIVTKQPVNKAVPQPPSKITYRGTKRPKPHMQPHTVSTKQIATKPNSISTPAQNKKKNRLIPIITSAVVLASIVGVVMAYFFLPNFSVWVAAQRSGVNAVSPVYAPAGYKVKGVAESSQGLVTINYYSNGLNDGYSITQANSNWDSAGVLENKVKPLGGSYQTLSQKGLTIYRYSTSAIWVNGGILYTITDEGKLSNEQILHIVDGI